MSKKIELVLTEKEFGSLIDAIDSISAMIGVGDDSEFVEIVENVDQMLEKNGFKRKYN